MLFAKNAWVPFTKNRTENEQGQAKSFWMLPFRNLRLRLLSYHQSPTNHGLQGGHPHDRFRSRSLRWTCGGALKRFVRIVSDMFLKRDFYVHRCNQQRCQCCRISLFACSVRRVSENEIPLFSNAFATGKTRCGASAIP